MSVGLCLYAQVLSARPILSLLSKGQCWNCVYVYGTSCIMCVKGCRLLKCACSVMKDADFFIAHDEREGKEEEKKRHVGSVASGLERVSSFRIETCQVVV